MNRRNFVSQLALLGGVGLSTQLSANECNTFNRVQKNAPTFVLVHGTWHGAWVWRDVRVELNKAGYRVETPTLTGCGEREHLSSPDIGLDTHIDDIVARIEYEELENVVLVGHSFSGLAITGAADRLRQKIKKVVFFDALVPRPGVMGVITPNQETGELPKQWLEAKAEFIDGYKMDFWSKYKAEMLVPASETQHIERLKRLITTHPAKTWTDQLILKNGGWHGLSRAYIHCVGQGSMLSSEWMYAPAKEKGWQFIELNTPRNGMMTHPVLVAQTFIQLANS
jgi:pimeloyl-ACP methyl ester carboxylesterase